MLLCFPLQLKWFIKFMFSLWFISNFRAHKSSSSDRNLSSNPTRSSPPNPATVASLSSAATNAPTATTSLLSNVAGHSSYASAHHVPPTSVLNSPVHTHPHVTAPPPPPPGNVLYPSAAYSDHGFLQMTLGYLSPSSGAYKSVDPYFLSQGR